MILRPLAAASLLVIEAAQMRLIAHNVLKRYGLALALASLALLLRGQLPLREGTAIYELPIAAVVLSAWYGGRGLGLFASLLCVMGTLYWFVPPVHSFAVSPDYALGFSIFIGLCLLLSEFSAGRRRAEHALRASEVRFRALVQASDRRRAAADRADSRGQPAWTWMQLNSGPQTGFPVQQ